MMSGLSAGYKAGLAPTHLFHMFSKLSANGHTSGDKDQGPHSQQGSFPVLATTWIQIPDFLQSLPG